jgi:hypothetical protein
MSTVLRASAAVSSQHYLICSKLDALIVFRKILIYLCIARLVRGKFPRLEVLQRYYLEDIFDPIIYFVRVGNFAGLEHFLDEHYYWFKSHRCLTIFRHRLKIIMLRNLFRFTFSSLGNSRTVSFELLSLICRRAGLGDFSAMDAECIAQSLIDQGLIRGYLAHAKQVMLVYQ